MNTVITIGREFGSGGRELGRRLAGELGFAYYDKEVLDAIVNKTELSANYVNDVVEGKMHRLYPITTAQTFGVYNFYYSINQQVQGIYKAQTEVLKDMAHRSDCVIVGRCADYILKDEEGINLFRLFVYADLESRLNRCKERASAGEDVSEKELKKNIQKVDKERARYYDDYTMQKWGDKANYDLCINTTNMVIEDMVPYLAKLFK